jgi:hypothetical protein
LEEKKSAKSERGRLVRLNAQAFKKTLRLSLIFRLIEAFFRLLRAILRTSRPRSDFEKVVTARQIIPP